MKNNVTRRTGRGKLRDQPVLLEAVMPEQTEEDRHARNVKIAQFVGGVIGLIIFLTYFFATRH
jgi:hypothetical protein